ncbi:hypothetical protein L484_013535 [Morus notabilis]|uniref:Uncharacterized protein n=1 Tax=Morus notabilis TaxID=981085 RepID=W9R2U6_9ROSA|nr:hypothetical protein L484_013535 [Morus notabilis]
MCSQVAPVWLSLYRLIGCLFYDVNGYDAGSSHMIISGYWVGPDVDDGWGFIEAFINPIC